MKNVNSNQFFGSLTSVSSVLITNQVENRSALYESKHTKVRYIGFSGKALVIAFVMILIGSVSGQVYAQATDIPDDTSTTESESSDNLPEISITGEGPTFEGEDAVFTIRSSIALREDLTINLDIVSSDFISGSISDFNQVTIPARETIVMHAVETDDDNIDEADGSISISLLASTTYDINSNASAATITILDNDPIVWITAADPITEGENAVFTVHSVAPAHSQLTIQLGVSDDNDDFITGIIPNTATIVAGASTGILVVQTEDDQTNESDGTIRVTLAEDINIPVTYSPISSDTGKHSALIIVRDNDAPATNQTDKLIVSIVANSSSVTEGENAVFTVTAQDDSTKQPVNVEENVIVKVLVSDGTSNFMQNQDSATSVLQATILRGSSSAQLTVPTIDDALNENDGVLDAVILGSYDYFIGETYSASIQIEDNDDEIPTISIVNHNSIVVEGGKAKFRLLTTSIPSSRIFVNVTMRQTGNFFGNPGNRRIGLKAGNIKLPNDDYQQHFRRFNIHTCNDQTDEADGSITVTLKSGTGYRIDESAKTATVLVKDNDGPKPTLRVIATKSSITEGESIEFKIVSSEPISDKFYFFYTLHSNKDNVATNVSRIKYRGLAFFDGTTTTNATEKTFTFSTIDDELIQNGGKVVLKLKSRRDKSYQISTKRAIVRVVDNDIPPGLPVVNLSTETPSIEEGQTAILTLESNQIAPANGLMVSYTKSQTGDFFASSFVGSGSVKIWARGSSEDFEFVTQDDEIDETDGSFTISLSASSSYTLGSNSSITVNVADNDESTLPVVSISTLASDIIEGHAPARITFSSNQVAPSSGLRVNYSVSQLGSFLDSFSLGANQVIIPAGETSKTISFFVPSDAYNEPDGSFTVTLRTASSYSLGTDSSVTVNVHDYSFEPTIYISDANAVYDADGAVAEFTVTSVYHFRGTKTINVSVTGVTKAVVGREIPSTVVLEENPYTYRDFVNLSVPSQTKLRVPIHEDQINEQTGVITVTLLPPTNANDYELISGQTSFQLNISDFDPPSSPLPVASVIAVDNQVDQVENFFFRFSLSHAVNEPLNVKFSLYYSVGNFTRRITGQYIRFDPGVTVFEYSSKVRNFGTGQRFKQINNDGYYEIRLESAPGYIVASSPNNHANTEIKRISEPAGISIISLQDDAEGRVARFQIFASSVAQSDRFINIDVNDGDSDFLYLRGTTKIKLPAGEI